MSLLLTAKAYQEKVRAPFNSRFDSTQLKKAQKILRKCPLDHSLIRRNNETKTIAGPRVNAQMVIVGLPRHQVSGGRIKQQILSQLFV